MIRNCLKIFERLYVRCGYKYHLSDLSKTMDFARINRIGWLLLSTRVYGQLCNDPGNGTCIRMTFCWSDGNSSPFVVRKRKGRGKNGGKRREFSISKWKQVNFSHITLDCRVHFLIRKKCNKGKTHKQETSTQSSALWQRMCLNRAMIFWRETF